MQTSSLYEDAGEGFRETAYIGTRCSHCNRVAVWDRDGRLVEPRATPAPPPHEDLPEDVAGDYAEAASIVNASPRGAAALLRLAVQKICAELGEKGGLDDAIGKLVQRGLDPTVQQALDVVRVIGNNAVHPGEINVEDHRDTALALFTLVNEITEAMISRPKRIRALYESLPSGAIDAIARRDRKTVGSD